MRAVAHASPGNLRDQRLRDRLTQVLGDHHTALGTLHPGLKLDPVLPPLFLLFASTLPLRLLRSRRIILVAVHFLLILLLVVIFLLHFLVLVAAHVLLLLLLLAIVATRLLAIVIAILVAAAATVLVNLPNGVTSLLCRRSRGARAVDAEKAPARGLGHQAKPEPRGRLISLPVLRIARVVVREDVHIGEEIVEHASRRIHEAVPRLRRDSQRERHPAHPLHHTLVGPVDVLELLRDGELDVDFAAASRRDPPLDDGQREPVVDAELALDHRQRDGADGVDGDVRLVVGDAGQGEVDRFLREEADRNHDLEEVSDRARGAAVVRDAPASRHDAGLVLERGARLVDLNLHAVRQLVQQAKQRCLVVPHAGVLVVDPDVVDPAGCRGEGTGDGQERRRRRRGAFHKMSGTAARRKGGDGEGQPGRT